MEPRVFYTILQVIGIIILICELLYAVVQKPSNIQKHLMFILLTTIISFIGYAIELMATDFYSAYVGCCLGYAGKPFALIGSLMLLTEYSNIKIKKGVYLGLVLFFLFLSLLVFTNPWNGGLYYKEIRYAVESDTKLGSPLVIEERGIFWYVYMVSSFIIFILYSVLVFYEAKQSRTKQAKQMTILLFFVVFFAFLGLFLFIFDLTANYDTTLTGILFGTIVFLILLTKYRMFDSLTAAQHKALNDSKDGVIILDSRMSLSYYNATAAALFPELNKNINRKNENLIIDKIDTLKDGYLLYNDDKVYELQTNIDTSPKGILYGKTYRFKEITEHYNYKLILDSEIKKATAKIKDLQRDTLISFASIVEARDGNTGEHIKRVARAAKLIAEQLQKESKYSRQISDEFIHILEECAPLHDIGKIYVSDSILLKPGKLTPEEFEIMKTHTTRGGEIIEVSIKELEEPIYVKTSQDIALSHHERWDGSGYPNKLKGLEIPLSARILAVADVYDALRQKRTYKESFSVEESIAIIKEESGTHFDPEIVDAFLKIYQNI